MQTRSPLRTPLAAVKALWAFVTLARDPNKLGMVFELRDSMASPEVVRPMAEHFRKDPEGAKALAERVRLRVDLAALDRLPKGTLGREFADHMRRNGLDPGAIPNLPSPDEIEFVSAHLYDTHDVWHVVTGFGTDVAGELGLQAFYLAQFPGPLSAAILSVGLLNTFLKAMDDRGPRMDAIAHGWTLGKKAKPFFGARWDELWEVPLDEVRRRYGVDGLSAPTPGGVDAAVVH